MFLVHVNEAFGYTHEQTLESSFAIIKCMLEEYNYMWRDRNREADSNGEFEWIELPDWDDPTKTKRVKKYKDVGHFFGDRKF